MNLRITAVVAEVAGLVLVLVVITWLEATLTQTRSFWPLIASSRSTSVFAPAMLARKARSR